MGHITLDDPFLVAMLDEAVSTAGYRERAVRAQRSGNLTGAESLYRTVVTLQPQDPDLHYELGTVLAQQGRFDVAADRFRQALALDPDHQRSLIDLGMMLTFQPRHDPERLAEAVAHLRRAAAAQPDDGQLRFHLAAALARSGDHAEAWEQAQAARGLGEELPPGFLEALRQHLPRQDRE